MKLYIVRHGETDFNRRGIVQGSGVDSNLNDNGLLQGNLFFNYYKNIPFRRIITSSLKRTHQTVAPFIERQPQLWLPMPELNEISWGEHEGKVGNEATVASYKQLMLDWESGVYDSKIEGGESAAELHQRVSRVVDFLKNGDFLNQNILLCTHGRTLLCLLTVLQNTPLSKMNNFKHQNTCLYLAHYVNGAFEFELENDVTHLNGMPTVPF
jgi:broad specificity phosphatase PhoE